MICFLCLLSSTLKSQDKIYFNTESTICYIASITPSVVTYTPLKATVSKSVDVKKILIIFNDKGVFLDPNKIDFESKKGQELVRKFLHEKLSLTTNYFFRADNSVITGEIVDQNKNNIYLANNGVIEKKSLLAIVYKGGRHEIIGSIHRAAEVLWTAYTNNFRTPVVSQNKTEKEVTAQVLKSEVSKTQTTSSDPRPQKISTNEPSNKVPDKTEVNLVSNTKIVPTDLPDDRLFESRKAEFQKKARDKAIQFSDYLKRILDKK